MTRRTNPDQIDLFAGQWQREAATTEQERVNTAGFGGTPDLLPEVLDTIHDGRIGQLDVSGRVVVLDGDGHCRHADDGIAAVVESLITQRYATEGEFTTQRHGAIAKNVHVVTLTNSGHRIRTRWSHLRGAG